LFASEGIENFEQSDAQSESFGGRRVIKLAEAIYEGSAARSRERIDLTGLAALTSRFSLGYPFMRHEAPKQWIYEIVVHVGLAESHASLFF
jgi:hypothetical protein